VRGGEGGETYAVSGGEGGEREVLNEGGLADAARPRNRTLSPRAEIEGEKALVEGVVDAPGVAPVEGVEGGERAEGGGARSAGEVSGVALAALELGESFAYLRGGRLGLGGRLEQGSHRLRR
jgi:hypothetical protein